MINRNALEDLLSGLCSEIIEKVKKDLDCAIPCIITKIYEGRTKVDVRPLIKVMGADESQTVRSEIKGIPVETIGAGGLLISFHLVAGDMGWLQASDRDISLFLQSYTDSRVSTLRKHSFSDARFIPDIMRNFVIDPEDESALVLQIRNNKVKIAIDQNQIRIQNNDARAEFNEDSIHITTSSVDMLIDGSSVTGTAPSGFNLNGFTIDASGAAVSPVSVTAPNLIAGTSITKASVEVADQDHTHNPGTYTAGGSAVSGISSGSNG